MNKMPILIPQGEDRKIAISLTGLPAGVTIDTVEATFSVSAGQRSVDFSSADIKTDADGGHYLAVATSLLGIGDLTLSAHVRIPDDDFSDGYRDEYPSICLNAKIIKR